MKIRGTVCGWSVVDVKIRGTICSWALVGVGWGLGKNEGNRLGLGCDWSGVGLG